MKKKKKECIYCGCNNELLLTTDHKTPRCRGGGDEEKNTQICCWFCNQLKGPLTHIEFQKYFKSLIELKRLKKVRVIFPHYLKIAFNQEHYPNGNNVSRNKKPTPPPPPNPKNEEKDAKD